jgi:peptidase C25-like protein
MLIGDSSIIVPERYSYPKDSYAASDYKYACVKGGDEYADVFFGRIPADTDTELTNALTKIMKYEKNPPQDSWLSRALLVAHREEYPGKYTAAKEDISKAAYSLGAPTFTKSYGGASNYGTTATNYYIDQILENTHFGIVNYRGHGSTTTWSKWNKANQYFYNTLIQGINNNDYTPVIFSISCHNNRFTSHNCIGKTWLFQSTSSAKGAVAHLGATNVSYTTPNHEYDRKLFKRIFDLGVSRISPASHFSHVYTMKHFKSTNTSILKYAKHNAYLYLVLGDPTMHIRTETPKSFIEVTGKNPIVVSDTSYTVTVRDAGGPVVGATVTIEKPQGSATPEFFLTGKTNSQGKVTFSITPTSGGNVYTTVSKYNYIVWQGDTVVPVELSGYNVE